jgi:DNA-directed RNA polymerase subunit RPC12/RpoP
MEVIPKRKFQCLDCGYEFEEPFGKPRWMLKCPKCASENIVRVDAPQGWGRGYCRGGRGFGFGGGRGRGWGRGRGRGWGFRFGWRG